MSKGTPVRHVRVEDALWEPCLAKAANRGDALSDIIRRALETYLGSEDPAVSTTSSRTGR